MEEETYEYHDGKLATVIRRIDGAVVVRREVEYLPDGGRIEEEPSAASR